jgi:hypothetical protein
MIAQQFQQVLLIYFRRATADVRPFIAALIAVIGAVMIATVPHRILGTQAWIAMTGPALIALNLKQQLVHMRERRLPAAVAAHVVVACLFLSLIAIGVPSLRMATVGPWCWGYPGFVLALVGVTVAAVIGQFRWVWLVVPFFFWGMLYPGAQQTIAELCHGEQEAFGMRLCMLGIGLIAGAIVWALRMTEEDRGYQTPWSGKPGDMYRRDAVPTIQSEAVKQMWNRRRLWPEPSAAKMAQWPIWAKGSLWNQIRLCESGRMMSTMQWVMFFFFPLFFLIPSWLMRLPFNFNNLSGFSFTLCFPAMIVIGQWYQQHPVWAMELLRPATRNRYLQASGLTLALWTSAAWGMQVFGWILIAAVVPAGVNWQKLWLSLVVSGAIQCLLFALGVWVMRYRSNAIWVATLGVTIGVASVIGNVTPSPTAALVFAAMVVVVSGGITYDAYRRWLNTELG